jgi:hypothetical protein
LESAAQLRARENDRRQTRRFVLRDRRLGFDRRHVSYRSPVGAALDSSLAYLRDHPPATVAVLALANLLSLLDLWLTTIVLRLGAVEVNPLMHYLFEASSTQAALVKVGLVAAATLGLWVLRRRRSALMVALLFLTVYTVLVLYEIVGLALFV